MEMKIEATTILGVVHKGSAALGGDGQVTLGNTVMKRNAIKIRKIANGKVLCGFAGASADAFTLMERFEDKLEQYRGNINRAAVEPGIGNQDPVRLAGVGRLPVSAQARAATTRTGGRGRLFPQNSASARPTGPWGWRW